ncbi:MAG TPA: DUF6351 family protein [Solirubrobacteraceae bacterium]|nr:DUF6351 family protein [Solirubrobacteraceae bacterium]
MRSTWSGPGRVGLAIGISAAILGCVAAVPAAAAKRPRPQISISVLSGRADLVSGGSALVAIILPARSDARQVKVTVGHRNVTRAFAFRRDGRFEGLLTRLALGRNVLRATLRSGWRAQITLTNHSNAGPVFSGPQLKPWTCEPGAVDAQCDKPPTFTYLYMSTDPSKHGFQPYDPSSPPSDVAQTTTDQGVTVPFIVRVETGYMDRDQYQITALFEPGKPWTAVAPQAQFNHKLLILHGVSCGVDYKTGTAPATTGDSAGDYALGKGFMTMSTALDFSGHNCNLALQAESLVMAKEYLVKVYGTLRYTIGSGCSGGSLAEQWIANAYPGIYQGILPTCSFPDAWSTASQFLDYHLLLAYFDAPSKWGAGVAWLPTQMGDVLGGPDGVANANVSDNAQFHVAVPTDPCAGTTAADRYDPNTNPGGVRCTIEDAAINVFGPEPAALWSANERKLGRGFVRPPIDNVGVQYGLGSLKQGQITPAQFVDLNAAIGGLDIDTNPTPGRIDNSGAPSLGRAYRSGMINETNNLNQAAIIDCRGPNPGLFHDAYRAFATRARLDREHGTHANQLIWEGPAVIIGDTACELNSFIAMDRWLAAVEKDHSSRPLPQKLIHNKPSDIGDECWDGAGHKVSDGLCPAGVVNVEATPRMVAGDAITTDANKCQLKPQSHADNPGITFTDPQWAQLQKSYPKGVCDFSKPGVDQQPTIPWLTYQDARGHVIYGGTPLGNAPASKEFRVRTTRR